MSTKKPNRPSKIENYVFISYSRYDMPFVDKIAADLRLRGFEIWIDLENIDPGANWQEEIENSIKKASALIFVISSNSLKSQWVNYELGSYVANKKKIIPIIIEDVDESKLPRFISQIQWADFRQSYDEGLRNLFESLGVSALKEHSVLPIEKRSKGYAFLSYSEEDIDFVSSLKIFLKQHGYAYWDYEESERDYHSQLFLELEGIIIEASATLSVLSESWKRSHWAVKEFFFSQDVNTPVFLLKAKTMGPTLAIAGMTHIDFTKDSDSGFSKLNRELKRKKL